MDPVQCHGLWVPSSDAAVFARYGEFEGLPDLDVRKVSQCAALCTSRRMALDIGAHVGAVAMYLGRLFERVIAFEAVPATFAYLERNVANVSNVEARNIAVGPSEGEVYFDHYVRHGQLSHVSSGSAKTLRVGPIPIVRIDSLDLPDIDFIKIDVEGFELPVLQGAVETIKRCMPLLLIEQAGNDELHFGCPRDEATVFLESLGMKRHSQEPRMSKDRLFSF